MTQIRLVSLPILHAVNNVHRSIIRRLKSSHESLSINFSGIWHYFGFFQKLSKDLRLTSRKSHVCNYAESCERFTENMLKEHIRMRRNE